MKVSMLDDSRIGDWSAYVDSRAAATLYHRVEWKGVMERNFNHPTYYLMAEDQGVRGILPLVFVSSRLFGSILSSMPFLNFGGVVADDEEAEAALLEEASALVHALDADYLELRHLEQSNAALPVKTHKVSMTVDLDPDPEVIWDSYKSKHRRNIRKALKSGLEFRTGGQELLDRFYEVLSRGWRELGTPIYARSFFEDILRTFGDDVQISLAEFDGTPVATAFDGFHSGTVEGMWAYARREFSSMEPNYFLYWKLIERACHRGCSTYHLGRSTAGSTAEFYKKKWNAVSKQLYWEYVLGSGSELPTLEVSNPKYRLAMAAWRKMPLWLTCRLGPLFSRNIP
jgi:FemAB-related protein (PEP-CTERM system-associated)